MTVPKINNNASFYSLSDLLLLLEDDTGYKQTPLPVPSSIKRDLKLNLNELSHVTFFTSRDICLHYVYITLRD